MLLPYLLPDLKPIEKIVAKQRLARPLNLKSAPFHLYPQGIPWIQILHYSFKSDKWWVLSFSLSSTIICTKMWEQHPPQSAYFFTCLSSIKMIFLTLSQINPCRWISHITHWPHVHRAYYYIVMLAIIIIWRKCFNTSYWTSVIKTFVTWLIVSCLLCCTRVFTCTSYLSLCTFPFLTCFCTIAVIFN